MSLSRILAAAALALAVAVPQSVAAQDKSFAELLRDLAGGGTADTPQAGADNRRVPFSAGEIQLSFAPLVQQTAPGVVNVYAERMTRQRSSPFEGDPFFEQFFGQAFRQAPPRVQSSLGSGVVVSGDGVVVTNYHVIEGADEVRVALSDGREFDSQLMLADKELDLAVLRIEPGTALPALPLGDSDGIAIGDLVLAIGNPFGVGQTTTSGIISATARSRIGVSDFGFFIQTDAAINPGNSGGALINMAGELIGINTAIFSRGGGSNGIGFAIPSNMVRAVVAQAVSGAERFERPWIGAEFDAVTPEIADALGMARPYGAIVTGVSREGPAAAAGLRPGDVVVAVNRAEIEHPDALGYRLLVHQAGDKVDLTVRRRARDIPVSVTLAKLPENVGAGRGLMIEGRSPFSGALVGNDGGPGVPIVDLAQGSPAAEAGFRPGDRILALNGEDVSAPEDVQRLTSANTRWWRFTIDRNGAIINQVLRY
jgi:Do/DeqQ family serine protease